MIDVYMSFYPIGGGEEVRRREMPQVPQAGDTVFYSLTGRSDDSRAWRVRHVAWVLNDHDHNWHAEIGLA